MKRIVPFALAAAVLLPVRAQAHCHIPRDGGVCYEYLTRTFSGSTAEHRGIIGAGAKFAKDATLIDASGNFVENTADYSDAISKYLATTYEGTTYEVEPHSMFIQDLTGNLVVADWVGTLSGKGTPLRHRATLIMRTEGEGKEMKASFLALRLVSAPRATASKRAAPPAKK